MPTTEEIAASIANVVAPTPEPATPPPAEVPVTEPPAAQPATAPTPEPEPAAAADDNPLAEDEQFENAELPIDPKTTRGQQVWDNHRKWQNLAKPVEEGGIGHEPTPTDIQDYYRSHRITQQILYDVDTGNPEFLEGMAKTNPAGMAQILQELPAFLTTGYAGKDPEASRIFEPVRQSIVKAVCGDLVQQFLQQARQQTDPAGRAEFLQVARNISTNFLGADLGEDALTPKAPSPYEAERKELEEAQKRVAESQRQYAEHLYAQFDQMASAEIASQVDAAVKAALNAYADRPGYKATAGQLMQMVNNHLLNNPTVTSETRVLWQQARRAVAAGRPPAQAWAQGHIQKLVQTHMKWARPFINQNLRNVAKDNGLFQSPGAAKKPVAPMPPAGTAPNVPVTAQPVERQPGESPVDFIARRIAPIVGRPN